jgi:hypothetical protein
MTKDPTVGNRFQELSEPFWSCPKPFRYPDSAGMKKRAEHTESDEPGSYLTKLRHTEGPSFAELWSEVERRGLRTRTNLLKMPDFIVFHVYIRSKTRGNFPGKGKFGAHLT